MINRNACNKQGVISKKAVLSSLLTAYQPNELPSPGVKNTHTVYELLTNIPADDWSILGFDARTRSVCIEVKAKGRVNHLSVTLPSMGVKSNF
jgi:hypothetical protein